MDFLGLPVLILPVSNSTWRIFRPEQISPLILNLMKLAREQKLLRFFSWLAETAVERMPDSLLVRLLLYALHSDSKLDAREIYRSLSTNPELKQRPMSVAEKLKAEGRVEGREEGLWIGKIQTLKEFLGQVPSSPGSLEGRALEDLKALHLSLHQAYEARFKKQ